MARPYGPNCATLSWASLEGTGNKAIRPAVHAVGSTSARCVDAVSRTQTSCECEYRMLSMKRVLIALGFAATIGLIPLASEAGTLDTVKQRGVLNCGANGQLPGFGLPDAQGNWTGFDVDYCR